MKQKNKLQTKKSEQGQSLVELAFSFLLIMFIISGAVDFGRAYFSIIALRDASQEGVIYASGHPTSGDVSDIEDRVQDSSSGPVDMSTVSDANVMVSWVLSGTYYDEGSIGSSPHGGCAHFYEVDGSTVANTITVRVRYSFPLTMPFIQGMFGGSIPLTVQDTHAIITPQCP